MRQHVRERARAAQGIDELIVATDDDRIASVASGFGASVEMTSPDRTSGTDRVAEVAKRRAWAQVVLNLQGDEPELETGTVSRLVSVMRPDESIAMGTIAHHEPNLAAMASENVVKVVVDQHDDALYFSRADVAFASRGGPALRHAGVDAFRRSLLLEFASWPPGKLEIAQDPLEPTLQQARRPAAHAGGATGEGDATDYVARLSTRPEWLALARTAVWRPTL